MGWFRKIWGGVTLRGGVSRVSVIRSGQLSVVVRLDQVEMATAAELLRPGALIELRVIEEAPKETK